MKAKEVVEEGKRVHKVWVLRGKVEEEGEKKEKWFLFNEEEDAIEKFKEVGTEDSFFQKLIFPEKKEKIRTEPISWKKIALNAFKEGSED